MINQKEQKIKDLVKRTFVINFVPTSLMYLTKILYVLDENGYKLKTAFLLDILHVLRVKSNKMKSVRDDVAKGFPLSSTILMNNYHNDYKKYINYLIHKDHIVKTANHKTGVNATKYRLNWNLFDEDYKYFKNKHKKIVNKKIERDFNALNNPDFSSIDLDIRIHLFKDLKKFNIDEFHYKNVLDDLLLNDEIDANKFKFNSKACDRLFKRIIDFSFDIHGRFHSNFTRLKKEVRVNAIRVDYKGELELTHEIDIQNSQPTLLLLILNNNKDKINIEEYLDYKESCRNGLIYSRMMRIFELDVNNNGEKITRKEAKGYFYQYLFGQSKNKYSRQMFRKMFPSIDGWLHNYKKENGYKKVAHKLQKYESDLIYNKIIKEIKMIDDTIPIITVHDSIIVPLSKRKLAEDVFYKHVNNIFDSVM